MVIVGFERRYPQQNELPFLVTTTQNKQKNDAMLTIS